MGDEDGLGGDAAERHYCYECHRSFATRTAWCVHAAKKHGRCAPLDDCTFSTHCVACLKEFHVRSRVQAHLAASSRCADAIRSAMQPPNAAVCDALRRHERMAKSADRAVTSGMPVVRLPSLRLEGPLPRWAAEAGL